jgi:hypothetical protein
MQTYHLVERPGKNSRALWKNSLNTRELDHPYCFNCNRDKYLNVFEDVLKAFFTILIQVFFFSHLATAQCAGGAIWLPPTADGSLTGSGSLAGYVNVSAQTSGNMSSGRPLYRVAAATWKSLDYASLQVWRAYSLPNGNATRFLLSPPLDSGVFHVRVDNIRGDFPNNETQSVRGFLNGVAVQATFMDPVNGATRSGNNILGGSSTNSTTQSSMRVFFHGPVDEIVIEQESFSDWVIAELLVQCNVVLNNHWFRWNAARQADHVLLSWSAETEPGSLLGYRPERSRDGRNFSAMGYLEKKNNTTYRFIDQPMPSGTYYFRLALIYQNGPELYSSVIPVRFSAENKFHAYPNPARHSLHINSTHKDTQFILNDAAGRLVARWFSADGNLKVGISQFQRGSYILRAEWNGGHSIQRIVFQ